MLIVTAEAEPVALVAVMSKSAVLATTEGVPVITQALDKLRPVGKVGDDEQLVIAPPEFDGVIVPTEVLFVKVNGEPE